MGLGIAGAAIFLPGAAFAAGEGGAAAMPFPELAALFLLIAGAAIYVALRQRRAMLGLAAERDRLQATVAQNERLNGAIPVAHCRWRRSDGSPTFSSGALAMLAGVKDFREVVGRCALPERAKLEAAIERLRRDGTAFEATVPLTDGRAVLDFIGRRLADVDVAAILDVSSRGALAADRAALRRQCDQLIATLDALPLPVWRRDDALKLVDCNRAYAAAVDAPAEKVRAEAREIAAGVVAEGGRALAARARRSTGPQSESHHIVIGGSRRLMEFTEKPVDGGGIVGFAQDYTDLENIQAELARHIAAHADVLENVAVAVAIYGPDTRLSFFNTSFASLWRLEEDWLVTEPTLDEVLERRSSAAAFRSTPIFAPSSASSWGCLPRSSSRRRSCCICPTSARCASSSRRIPSAA
jgi:PAS domain-containing protein